MISGKLVNLIERHREQILDRVVEEFRRDPEMAQIRAAFESELREWGRNLLEHLDRWLTQGGGTELEHRYERLGRLMAEEKIPLHQALRGLYLIREKILDYIEDEVPSRTPVDIYAEEQIARRLGRFFDVLGTHMARGYEQTLRGIARAAG